VPNNRLERPRSFGKVVRGSNDWDKASSFSASARRSTSSLDVMWLQVQRAILPSLLFLIFLTSGRISFAAHRIVKRLQTNYPVLWEDLGSPNPVLYLALGFDVAMVLPSHRPRLTDWFRKGHYLKIDDPEIHSLARGLKFQYCLLSVLAGLSALYVIFRVYSYH